MAFLEPNQCWHKDILQLNKLDTKSLDIMVYAQIRLHSRVKRPGYKVQILLKCLNVQCISHTLARNIHHKTDDNLNRADDIIVQSKPQ